MCVLIDDMIDTAGTICAAAEILYGKRAPRRCGPCAPTPCCPTRPPTASRTRRISRVVITDTLPLPPEKQIDKIEVVSVAKIFADAIDAVFGDGSVSEIFGGENQT